MKMSELLQRLDSVTEPDKYHKDCFHQQTVQIQNGMSFPACTYFTDSPVKCSQMLTKSYFKATHAIYRSYTLSVH